MEAIIQIQFTPDVETGIVSPLSPQYAGVQGDRNVAYVSFTVPPSLRDETFRYRIEGIDGAGGYITTPLLPIGDDGTVGTLLDTDITGAGGQAILRLAVSQIVDGKEIVQAHSFDGRIYFADAETAQAGHTQGSLTAMLDRLIAKTHGIRHLADGETEGSLQSMHARDDTDYVIGTSAVALGISTVASGNAALAEGTQTKAQGYAAHAEGVATEANGSYSHAEGRSTKAGGNSSHAEGIATVTEAEYAHAEGANVRAEGQAAHAEGVRTLAKGRASHAGGSHTDAAGDSQTAVGRYNKASDTALFIVGNGSTEPEYIYDRSWDVAAPWFDWYTALYPGIYCNEVLYNAFDAHQRIPITFTGTPYLFYDFEGAGKLWLGDYHGDPTAQSTHAYDFTSVIAAAEGVTLDADGFLPAGRHHGVVKLSGFPAINDPYTYLFAQQKDLSMPVFSSLLLADVTEVTDGRKNAFVVESDGTVRFGSVSLTPADFAALLRLIR